MTPYLPNTTLVAVILISGLSSATAIWLTEDRIERQRSAGDANPAGPLSPEDSRRYTHDVQLYYGETGLLMDKWKRWLEEMTHGKGLAETLAVGSLGAAAGLFWVARKHRNPARLAKGKIEY
jgi:hypothetical protein